jgi:ferritin-like metal-binding protein YciE
MEDLMLEELRELYSAERLALRAYPRMRKAIQTDALREAVEHHTEQTKEQVERLTRVFEMMDAKPRAKTCHSMQGLIEEAQEHLDADLEPELMEVMLIADLQKIEHLEIAAYGSAKSHAEALGYDEVAELLEDTLNEEKETDALLKQVAVEDVNPRAAGEMEEEGEEEEDEPARQEAAGRAGGGRGSRGNQAAGRR